MENLQVPYLIEDGSIEIISCCSDDFLLEGDEETVNNGLQQSLKPERDSFQDDDLSQVSHVSSDELFKVLNLKDLDQVLEQEKGNLKALKEANMLLKRVTSRNSEILAPEEEPNVPVDSIPAIEKDMGNADVTGRERATLISNPFRGLLSHKLLRKRKPAQHPGRARMHSKSIQDYYNSMGVVSRYMIGASVIGFCVAFLTLTMYGAQMHHNNIEIFKMKEKQFLAQQALFEKGQRKQEDFRETLIHQRYEEARECRSTLQSYINGKDDLFKKISNLEEHLHLANSNLRKVMEFHKEQVEQLQLIVEELQHENLQLKMGKQKSGDSSYFKEMILGFASILSGKFFDRSKEM